MTEVRCWRDQAACRDVVTTDYDPFFADSAELQAEAIAICESCLVCDDCLTFAVRTGQQYGIWGGQPQQLIRRWRRLRTPDVRGGRLWELRGGSAGGRRMGCARGGHERSGRPGGLRPSAVRAHRQRPPPDRLPL